MKQEVFGKHMETLELDCVREHDQLTAELKHFVDCVRTGRKPRVTGEDGRDALELAERVLESVRTHAWEGSASGPIGHEAVGANARCRGDIRTLGRRARHVPNWRQ